MKSHLCKETMVRRNSYIKLQSKIWSDSGIRAFLCLFSSMSANRGSKDSEKRCTDSRLIADLSRSTQGCPLED